MKSTSCRGVKAAAAATAKADQQERGEQRDSRQQKLRL